MKRILLVFVVLIQLFVVGCVSQKDYNELKLIYNEKNTDYIYLEDKNDLLDEELTLLKDKVNSLNKEISDIKNNSTNQLVKIRNHFEKEEFETVITLSKKLHEEFNGTNDDIEAQKLKNFAEKEINDKIKKDKEEKDRKIEENRKSEKDKAKNIIKITKFSKSQPNSAGGVDVFVGFKNMSEKTIKYATFEVMPYNAVGDPVDSEIGNKSRARLNDVGPYKNGQGSNGTDSYWENVWYSFQIDTVRLLQVEIEYMDGTTIIVDGDHLI